ncbi:growth arrest and DNA damage-inducible protein GADD45 beta-like [Thunnus albacares]|uniref:growth arrest and DNA damage-inducible protein GADD45 beta-like n=1 Tax=Thunnus maccoyii TaxID=8240 RepID=UPI001C4B1914|nr:growth arrest and DNA damage-inducible protein GADD45 beta-like [Thunnus maccoyii]XP_044230853.1 growth arrest and DNA damage-inducible protein GADD45 beta-like [Thunnus albacares]|eukprot:superscaffoldBa00002799_g15324
MIPEESFAPSVIENRVQSVGLALEELLVTAQKQDCLTVGIYESAKLLNAEPDSVVLCVLAADGEDDVALQIHFTLLQSFCCDSGITILRVSGVQRLQQLLGAVDANRNQEEHRDLHCMLVTNPQAEHCRLQEVGTYCQESRRLNQWVPELVLQER